jgi:hypothetical protein
VRRWRAFDHRGSVLPSEQRERRRTAAAAPPPERRSGVGRAFGEGREARRAAR